MDWRIERKDCRVQMIFAALPTKMGYGPMFAKVVEEASARHDIDDLYTVHSDHLNACRPEHEDDPRFKLLTGLIDPHVRATCETAAIDSEMSEIIPFAPIEDGTMTACTKHVEEVLRELEEIRQRQGLSIEKQLLEEIQSFPDIQERLSAALDNAGCVRTCLDYPNHEYWERVKQIYV